MGAALFVNEAPGIAEFFEADREIVTYSSVAQLVEKFSYFLRNPVELAEIGRRGQLWCLSQHTMEHRAQALNELLRNALATQPSAKPPLETQVSSKIPLERQASLLAC